MFAQRRTLIAGFVFGLVALLGALSFTAVDAADAPAKGKAQSIAAKMKARRAEQMRKAAEAPQPAQDRKTKAEDVAAAVRRSTGDFRKTFAATEVTAAVTEIDKLVEADWKRHSVEANPPATDEVFLRRIYLDITGTIPNYEQTKAFLDSKDPNKRAKLIDQLLDSPGYVSHNFNYWADLLRVTSRLTAQANGNTYIQWVKDALASNMPYDKFVYELLSSEGRLQDSGAAGYFVRDSGMPLDNASNTVRIFLGTSIGCAQCHDHPFDKWTQYEFYEMAAYTFGVETRIRDNSMRELGEKSRKELDPNAQAMLRRMIASNSYGANDARRQLRLPDDYKYDDAKPKETVAPHTIWGENAEPSDGETTRQAYARWVTSRENERFTLVIANRLWKRAFGTGLIEPVDEITDDTKPSNPELMAYLEELMKRADYDMKAYLRIIYNTKTYQRMASSRETGLEDTYRFPGPQLRRMTAEQMWDSFLTIAMPNPDGRKGVGNYRGNIAAQFDITKKSSDEIIALAKEASENRQVLQRKVMAQAMNDPNEAEYRGFQRDFVRAAEVESPARPGHFLRQFGQSDRELIDGANTEPSVTQALTLLNGLVEKNLLGNNNSVLRKNLSAAKDPAEKVRVIFLSVLNRYPNAAEMATAQREIRDSDVDAYGNIVWAVINTREFLFVQ